MTQKLKKAKEGPVEGVDEKKGTRKRTPSVEIVISRLKDVIEEKPKKARQLLEESEKEVSSEDHDVSPMALVIAANATVLQRFSRKTDEPIYDASIKEHFNDDVKITMGGMLVDLEQILTNYRSEIERLETSRRKRIKYLFNQIPGMAMQLRPAARWGASVFTGVSFWGAMYLALRSTVGDVYAVIAGAAIAGTAFYTTSKRFGEFVSNSVIRLDDWVTAKLKKRAARKCSEEKTAKLKTMAKTLQKVMSSEKKQYEIDYEAIEEIGKTMPSPFDIKPEEDQRG